jgi:hypothetical protein
VLYISVFTFVDSHIKTKVCAVPNDSRHSLTSVSSNSLFLSFSEIRILISRMDQVSTETCVLLSCFATSWQYAVLPSSRSFLVDCYWLRAAIENVQIFRFLRLAVQIFRFLRLAVQLFVRMPTLDCLNSVCLDRMSSAVLVRPRPRVSDCALDCKGNVRVT